MTEDNTVFVQPNSKIPCYDNIFFKQGDIYNQGNIFDWDDNEFLSALDTVENKFKKNPININGLKLQETFTYSNMVNSILEILNKI
jgi:hypothetical protein